MTRSRPGLCATCAHARVVQGRRSSFLRCGLSDTDPRFDRYPGLPVLECLGYVAIEAPLEVLADLCASDSQEPNS